MISARENNSTNIEATPSAPPAPGVEDYPSLGSLTNNLKLGTGSSSYPTDPGFTPASRTARVVLILLVCGLLTLAVRYRNTGSVA